MATVRFDGSLPGGALTSRAIPSGVRRAAYPHGVPRVLTIASSISASVAGISTVSTGPAPPARLFPGAGETPNNSTDISSKAFPPETLIGGAPSSGMRTVAPRSVRSTEGAPAVESGHAPSPLTCRTYFFGTQHLVPAARRTRQASPDSPHRLTRDPGSSRHARAPPGSSLAGAPSFPIPPRVVRGGGTSVILPGDPALTALPRASRMRNRTPAAEARSPSLTVYEAR